MAKKELIGRVLYVDSNGHMELKLPEKALKDYTEGKTIHLIINKKTDYGEFKIENP